jgi:hypothetical protein
MVAHIYPLQAMGEMLHHVRSGDVRSQEKQMFIQNTSVAQQQPPQQHLARSPFRLVIEPPSNQA